MMPTEVAVHRRLRKQHRLHARTSAPSAARSPPISLVIPMPARTSLQTGGSPARWGSARVAPLAAAHSAGSTRSTVDCLSGGRLHRQRAARMPPISAAPPAAGSAKFGTRAINAPDQLHAQAGSATGINFLEGNPAPARAIAGNVQYSRIGRRNRLTHAATVTNKTTPRHRSPTHRNSATRFPRFNHRQRSAGTDRLSTNGHHHRRRFPTPSPSPSLRRPSRKTPVRSAATGTVSVTTAIGSRSPSRSDRRTPAKPPTRQRHHRRRPDQQLRLRHRRGG